jgi:hypothetical protein
VQLLTLANHLRSSTTTSSAGDSTDSETVAAANAIRKGELPTGYLILHPLFRRDRPDLLTGIVRRLNNEPLEVRGTAIATHRPDDHADSHPHAAGEPHQRSQRQHHRHHYQRKRKLELDNPLAEFESTVSLLKSTAKSFAAIENEWETRSDTSLVDDMDPRERVEQLTRSFSDILHNMRGVNLIISTQLQNQIKTLRETVDRRNETIEEMIRLVQNMPNSTTNQLYFNE